MLKELLKPSAPEIAISDAGDWRTNVEFDRKDLNAAIEARSAELFREHQQATFIRTDRLFAWLLFGEWLAGIVIALLISPMAWAGSTSEVHVHVWTAIFLGGIIVVCPIVLAMKYPGQTETRHSIAIGQMLYSALLIHLTGGRIETHFHVFGSLAFISFYRDWRVLISASAVVALDHILRGYFFPQSVYGVLTIEPWRWAEHAWWLIFEDAFLIKTCRDQVLEMRTVAARQAEVEETRARVEDLVNERTKDLQASQHENAQLAQIVHSSHDAIISQTLDGTMTSWNRGAERLFGYSSREAIGLPISTLIHSKNATDLVRRQQLEKSTDTVDDVELVCIKRDGESVIVSTSRAPIADDKGSVTGISTIMRDITVRKEAEKRVNEFYSMVSHELRTPLTSIRGVLGLIEGGMVAPEEVTELVQLARENSERLIRLINDILDLKKIQAGKMSLHRVKIDCGKLLEETLEPLKSLAAQGAVSLSSDCPDKSYLYADHDKVTQVLTNLISNAVKFSPEGADVSVQVSYSDSPDKLRFSIVDRGKGIQPQEIHKLFGKFQQFDSSDTRAKGGTGLGLAISKGIVEQHEGSIGVESIFGEGSTFWFELPIGSEEDCAKLNERDTGRHLSPFVRSRLSGTFRCKSWNSKDSVAISATARKTNS